MTPHLLDTHAWIQCACSDPVPARVQSTIASHADSLALDAISLWEAANLVEFGHLQLPAPSNEFFRLALTSGFTVVPLTPAIAERVTRLEAIGFHKDPADRIIVAIALMHGLKLISKASRIRLWAGVATGWRTSHGKN